MSERDVRQVVFAQDGVIMGQVSKRGAEIIMMDALAAGHEVQEYYDLYYGKPGFNVRLTSKQ